MTTVGSSGNHKGKNTDVENIFPQGKRRHLEHNESARSKVRPFQDYRRWHSWYEWPLTGQQRSYKSLRTDVSTLMLNLALHLSIHVRHVENCCVFTRWVCTWLAKGLFAYSRQKCVPGEKSLCVKSYTTGREGLQTRFLGCFMVWHWPNSSHPWKLLTHPPPQMGRGEKTLMRASWGEIRTGRKRSKGKTSST